MFLLKHRPTICQLNSSRMRSSLELIFLIPTWSTLANPLNQLDHPQIILSR
jgi:hypothetical protein